MTRDMLATRWAEIGSKVVALAEEFPEQRFDMRPVDGTRTFADQLRHVAFWNQYLRGALRGQSPDGSPNALPREAYATKAKVVQAVRESFDQVRSDIESNMADGDQAKADTIVSYIGHNAEHYGQLALYFRLNGMVPPASR